METSSYHGERNHLTTAKQFHHYYYSTTINNLNVEVVVVTDLRRVIGYSIE